MCKRSQAHTLQQTAGTFERIAAHHSPPSLMAAAADALTPNTLLQMHAASLAASLAAQL
jgi:hypothetical protein